MTSFFGVEKAFAVGDDAWIFVGDHGGQLSQGKVVAVVNLPGHPFPHYIIEIETGIDPLLEIRGGGFGIFRENIFAEDETVHSSQDHGAKS